MTAGLLHEGLARTVDRSPDHPAVLEGDEAYSFADLAAMAAAIADALAGLGVAPGDRVVLMTANRVEFIGAVEAVSQLGAAVVLVNPTWKVRELGDAVDLTGATFAIADRSTREVVTWRFDAARTLDLDADPPNWAPSSTDSGARKRPVRGGGDGDEDDEVVLVFSSGTTGMPKAVRHSHRSLGHAIDHWRDALGLGADDRLQIATPPSHILGLLNVVTAIDAGATVRLHRRFELGEVLDAIERDHITLEMAVAPIALAIAKSPGLESRDLSSLRYIMWGATPVNESVATAVTARTGVRWLPAYGASEVPVIAANPVGDPDAWRLDSVGLPPTGVELRVVDLETRRALGSGETGEIEVRSPSLMLGYLPEAATDGAVADGWYRTGDLGHLDEGGWVHLTDRVKEMIKVRGFQVAPAEIEGVLLEHPGVLDCAVFGVPDEAAGEAPVAAVRVDPASPPTTEELAALVAGSLASYKQLAHVIVVDEIPRLPSGKALRRHLRAEWAPRLSAGKANA